MSKVHQEQGPNNSDEIHLKDFINQIKKWWHFMLSKWVVIAGVSLAGALIGLAVATFKKPIYVAELSFALQDDKSSGGLSGALGLASQFGIDLGGLSAGGEFSGDNLLELMKSRTIINKTLLTPVNVNGKQETLAQLYISFNNLRDIWEGKPELEKIDYLPGADPSKFSLKQDSMLSVFYKDLLKDNVVVDKVDKKLTIIGLIVRSKNQLFSKYFAEVLVKVVSDFYVQTKTKKGVQNVAVLQRQTDSVRKALNEAISGVASSIDANPNPNPSFQSLHVPSQRRQVDVQANTAILSELVKNLEVSKMSLMQSTPLIQIIDAPILPLEKEKMGRLTGIVLGGILGAMLIIVFLTVSKIYKTLIRDNA